MALLYVADEHLPALWSLCVQALEEEARPRDVRDACAAVVEELLASGRLTDVERHEREAMGRAIRARRSAAPSAPSAWRLARPAGAALGAAGAVEACAALAGGAAAALVVAGLVALLGAAVVWVDAMRAAKGGG